MLADLHMHSTASDGALDPAELMRRASEAGVELIALTDHDCVDGLESAAKTAGELGMRWVSGVEMSAQWYGHTLHILGYAFDPLHPVMMQSLAEVRDGRWRRAEQIDKRLAAKRMPGAYEGAVAAQLAAGGQADQPPGRPHFADWMVTAGHVSDRGEAFRKWLDQASWGISSSTGRPYLK